jgi:protocatechuate 3,4-dioxygenase beta subunit
MKSKPFIFLTTGLAIALIALLLTLRHNVTSQNTPENQAEEYVNEDLDAEHAHASSRAVRVTRFHDDAEPAPARNYQPSPVHLAQAEEDFEAQKLRAFGDSYIFGIVRGDDNKPVADARILLYENDPNTTNPPLREAISDKEGSFTLSQLHDGDRRFVLVAKAEGFAPEAHFVFLRGQPTEQDIRLRPGVPVTGTVVDGSTSQPLAGVTIVQPNEGDTAFAVLGSITSGPDGRFHFPFVHPGPVATIAQHPGYRTTRVQLRAPKENLEIRMIAGGATIRGTTVDRLSGKPRGGAKVWLEGNGIADSRMSSADGTFEFTEVPGGAYEMYGIRGMRSEKQKVEVTNTEVKEGVVITLPSDLFVSGKVINVNKGKPLPGIKIWYRSPSGRNSVLSDQEGRFAFETLAVNTYTIEIHEKGLVPAGDKRTTSIEETITRPVPKNASSDTIIVRLRQVPVIEGIVRGSKRQDGPVAPLFGADVAVDYLHDKDHRRVMTRSDIDGKFFVNLPTNRPGEAKILAFRNFSTAAEGLRLPQRRPAQLTLKRNVMFATVLLVDQAPLEGMKVEFGHFLPDNRPEHQALLIKERDFYSNRGGRLIVPLPENQKVQLTFNTLDGNRIPKTFNTNQLLNSQPIFIYDPVTKDILSDVKPRNRPPRAQGTNVPGNQNPRPENQANNRRNNGEQRPERAKPSPANP